MVETARGGLHGTITERNEYTMSMTTVDVVDVWAPTNTRAYLAEPDLFTEDDRKERKFAASHVRLNDEDGPLCGFTRPGMVVDGSSDFDVTCDRCRSKLRKMIQGGAFNS